VFSTLHTNSAPESITRLLDMGMDPFNFADAILAIMAQRLVRTLCKDCKKRYNPTEEEYNELVREYGEEEFQKNLNIPYSDDMTLYKPEGCDICNSTGYRGRMAIHELLMGTDEMKKLIQQQAKMEDLREQAVTDGMTTLKQDGIAKIFGGNSDLLQVRKVCIK
jgi:type II secretory ATPase GspE/PulE/Tfp pilus assembly ATPase PilB-like protein